MLSTEEGSISFPLFAPIYLGRDDFFFFRLKKQQHLQFKRQDKWSISRWRGSDAAATKRCTTSNETRSPTSSQTHTKAQFQPPHKKKELNERKQKKKILHPHESGPICSHLASSLIDVLHWWWCTQLQKIFHRFCSCLIRTKPPTQGQKKELK